MPFWDEGFAPRPQQIIGSLAPGRRAWLRHVAHSIGIAHLNGEGVGKDIKKVKHFHELAAMGGHVIARHSVGAFEAQAGNMSRAMKHWMIAARAGYDDSLANIRQGYWMDM